MDPTTPPISTSQKIHIYLSTLLVYINFMMTVGIISRIKDPMSKEFGLSESFLGFLDGISFIGGFAGFMSMGVFPLKKPVIGAFFISILFILSMESLILSKLTDTLQYPLLTCSRFLCGFFRAYNLIPYVILNFYYKNQNYQYLIQIWYAIGMAGDILGVVIPQLLINKLKLDWSIAMTITLCFLLLSTLYLLFAVKQITIEESPSNSAGFTAMAQFITTYWSKGLNLLHSIIFLMSAIYYLMILWLPYFFIRIGYHDQGGALISIAYPFAYIMSGFLFQPLQIALKGYIGRLFLVVLILNSILAFFLNTLGDDPSQIPLYIILIFGCSILSSGFSIFTQTIDQNNRANNTRQLVLVNSINGCTVQIVYMTEMIISGIIMEKDLHNLFILYGVMTGLCIPLHVFRMIKYPDSFQTNRIDQQGDSQIGQSGERSHRSKDDYRQLSEREQQNGKNN